MLFHIIFVIAAFRRAYSITTGEVMKLAMELDQKTRMNGYSPHDTCINASAEGGSLCNALSFTSQVWRNAVKTTAKSYVVSTIGFQVKKKQVPSGSVCFLESYKAYIPDLSSCEVEGDGGNILRAYGHISCLYQCVDLASVLGLDRWNDMWSKLIVKNDDFQWSSDISRVPGSPSPHASYRCGKENCRLGDVGNSICFITSVRSSNTIKDMCYMNVRLNEESGYTVEEIWIKKGSDQGGDCGFRCLSMDMEKLH